MYCFNLNTFIFQSLFYKIDLIIIRSNYSDIFQNQIRKYRFFYFAYLSFVCTFQFRMRSRRNYFNSILIIMFGLNNQFIIIKTFIAKINNMRITTIMLAQQSTSDGIVIKFFETIQYTFIGIRIGSL